MARVHGSRIQKCESSAYVWERRLGLAEHVHMMLAITECKQRISTDRTKVAARMARECFWNGSWSTRGSRSFWAARTYLATVQEPQAIIAYDNFKKDHDAPHRLCSAASGRIIMLGESSVERQQRASSDPMKSLEHIAMKYADLDG